MTIPTYDALMGRVLTRCAEGEIRMRDLIRRISDDLGLAQAEREALLPGGSTTVIANRCHWAKTYLKKAGLVRQPGRGLVAITEAGRSFLSQHGDQITLNALRAFPDFIAFMNQAAASDAMPAAGTSDGSATNVPEEQIQSAERVLTAAIRDALLERIMEASPAFFERMVIDLLLAMGYGGSRAAAAKQLGRTGDGGVDGVINEDQFGLDRIYLQAKRYSRGNSVGSETVRGFIGALIGKGAQKGLLITTSSFSEHAKEAAARTGGMRLVLIDGEELTGLLVRFNVGVRVARTVEIKRVNLDYFDQSDPE